MPWYMKSLTGALLGIGFLGLAYLAETHTWGNPLTLLFGLPGVLITLTGLFHFLLNTLVIQLGK